ncbi:MAG: MotA/TolQ/ExbB proton channel family protein [Candidatus Omnitrophica bacterium]|nr:MotA/TolQ/ExbB proton channel family protein [Candidatus Omnitrophota bacterium]
MGFWQLLSTGGATVYVLLLLSVLSLAIIVERTIFYIYCSRVSRETLMEVVRVELKKGFAVKALDLCKKADTPSSRVVATALERKDACVAELENTMDRQMTVEISRLERRISIVGTIGSTAVYIGLFGTVLGIIKAFQDIADKGNGGVGVVINGIAEALICTAVGLCVAVPAVIAYNYFIKKIEDIERDMEVCASETVDLLRVKA